MSLICFSICSLSWSASWRIPVSVADFAGFLLLGVTGWIGHSFLLRAMELEQASALAPLSYFQLVSAPVFGYFFFSQISDLWTLTGAAIIAGSGILCASIRQA
jgi:drug/metabolite transporter (DMT)-like permease